MSVIVNTVGRSIGLDVHLDFCEIAVCEDGKVRSAGRVKSSPEDLKVLAESLLPTDKVALEVTGSAWEIVGILEPHVAKLVAVSGDTGISQARANTDGLDARTLARLLWAGELEAVWRPDEHTRVLRRRLSRREQLVRSRSRSKNEVHAVLMRRLVGRCPFSTDQHDPRNIRHNPLTFRRQEQVTPRAYSTTERLLLRLSRRRAEHRHSREVRIVRAMRTSA